MLVNDIDLLAIRRGVVTAPAGCGKTHLIAKTLTRHNGSKPILVLTHTNAGVVALRGRLAHAGVSSKVYRLSTIDGWAMRLVSTFPTRSAIDINILKLLHPKTDYPNIRVAAINLLMSGHVNDILAASYDRLIVDEYQDCSWNQHVLVTWVDQTLSTCVLGDPLQAIFGFGEDRLAKWDEEVCKYFSPVGELSIPWRWINANSEPLGSWLFNVRDNLLKGTPIDISLAPASVSWVQLDGSQEDYQRQLAAAKKRLPDGVGHTLIIGESTRPDSQQLFASQTPGAVTVEAVDLKDLVSFASDFDLTDLSALEHLVHFAQRVMTNVGAKDLIRRIQSLTHGTAHKPPTDVEKSAITFVGTPSYRNAADLLVAISKGGDVRIHRPAILNNCIKALQLCGGTDSLSFHTAAIQMREQNRLVGRSLPRRAVGSTLLLKGLEAESAIILNADNMNTKNLYVAMTRGSKSLTICSRTNILTPR